MKEYNYTHDGIGYHRVSRPLARRAFERGHTVCLCSDKMRPDVSGVYLKQDDCNSRTFEQLENEFAYYNCAPNMGARIAFYISDDIVLGELYKEKQS